MSTQKSTVDFILNQIPGTSARKMFGEYALYFDTKVVALVCDDQLFVKITPISSQFLDDSHQGPPYPGAKPWLNVPEEQWEDREWLSSFIRATADVLPAPKPKKKKP